MSEKKFEDFFQVWSEYGKSWKSGKLILFRRGVKFSNVPEKIWDAVVFQKMNKAIKKKIRNES